jgi:hypothetical protein
MLNDGSAAVADDPNIDCGFNSSFPFTQPRLQMKNNTHKKKKKKKK